MTNDKNNYLIESLIVYDFIYLKENPIFSQTYDISQWKS